jgi:hypothetical protein
MHNSKVCLIYKWDVHKIMRFVVKCSAPEFLFLAWHSTHSSGINESAWCRPFSWNSKSPYGLSSFFTRAILEVCMKESFQSDTDWSLNYSIHRNSVSRQKSTGRLRISEDKTEVIKVSCTNSPIKFIQSSSHPDMLKATPTCVTKAARITCLQN